MNKLILIDGNSLLYRGFFATRIFTTTDGFPTNALFSLSNMLIKILEQDKPDYIIAAFDTPTPTFRHVMYEEYKAQRKAPAPELISQMEPARSLIRNFGIHVIEAPGYEADDIIGTISLMASKKNIETHIYTGDLDSLQLIDDNTSVYITAKGVSDINVYNEQSVQDRYCVSPLGMIDFKGLKGDTSDNIPGVPGIGDKTAANLLKEYGSIEGIYNSIASMKESKVKSNLIEYKDQAFLSKELATIDRDIPIEFDFSYALFDQPNYLALKGDFIKYQFRSLMKYIPENVAGISDESSIIDSSDTPDVVLIDSDVSFEKLVSTLKKANKISVYLNMGSLDNIKSVSVYLDNTLYEIPMKQPADNLGIIIFDEPFGVDIFDLESVFSDQSIQKTVYDAKAVYKLLFANGVEIKGIDFDIMLGSYLLDPAKNTNSLEGISFNLLGKTDNINAYTIKLLRDILVSKLDELSLKLHDEIELPLAFVLAKMELLGIELDSSVLKDMSEKLDLSIKALTQSIYKQSGAEFNIASSKQLTEVLFDKLQIPYPKDSKKRSTGAEILELLDYDEYPIIKDILQFRELSKIKNTYTDSLINLIDSKTGRIHTTFNQTVTSTGRLSSSEPNLQNIPIRTEIGRGIRKAFVSSKGYSLISADYSQVEFRIFAHITRDEWLVNAFKQDMDIHTATAATLFGVDEDKVDSDMRRKAKTLNFAILYGMADFTLSKQLGCSVKEAREFIDKYFARFPNVKKTTEQIIADAENTGYVSTILGRRRYIPEINSENRQVRMAAQRAAVNMPFQGSSADIIKLAMVNISDILAGKDAYILLQIHDELLIEAPDNNITEIAAILKDGMEHAYELIVPLKTDVKIGKNWLDMEKI